MREINGIKYYTADEAANILKLTKTQINKLCRLEKLKSIRMEVFSHANLPPWLVEANAVHSYNPRKKTGLKFNSAQERFKHWYSENAESYKKVRKARRDRARLIKYELD